MSRYKIPVVFGLDEKYVLPAFVVMYSILEHSNEYYQFYFITTDNISEKTKKFAALLQNKHNNFNIFVQKIHKDLFEDVKIYNHHLSIAAYFRLLIPDILCESDKCIYLDCDILVNGDLKELFQLDLGNNYLAGVKDCHIIKKGRNRDLHQKLLELPSMDRYINSGVLVMNLKKMRDNNIVNDFLKQMKKENWFEDQDVLNRCCYPYIKTLPLVYNLFHFYSNQNIHFLYSLEYEREDFHFDKPFIIHMGGVWKPWNSKKVKFADVWWKYAKAFADTCDYHEYEKNSQKEDCLCSLFQTLEKNKEHPFVICGFSENGKRLCEMMMVKGYTNIVSFADNDETKWKQKYREIPVNTVEYILKYFNDAFWIISNQLSFKEVQNQLLSYQIDSRHMVRYVNKYEQKMYLLSLDEKFYDFEIGQIAEFEYAAEVPDDRERKDYLLKILDNPNEHMEEYNCLDKKYHFNYWYNSNKGN